jgi:hypothetical protein
MARVIFFITEMPMVTMLVLVLQDTQALDFDCPWKNFPISTKSMTISSPGRDSERSFVCLFVCLYLECGS